MFANISDDEFVPKGHNSLQVSDLCLSCAKLLVCPLSVDSLSRTRYRRFAHNHMTEHMLDFEF